MSCRAPTERGSLLAWPDPPLQRIVERVSGGERLFDLCDADTLGALREQPAGEFRHFAACAMQRDKPVRGSKRVLDGS
jgi:hypothetical protein